MEPFGGAGKDSAAWQAGSSGRDVVGEPLANLAKWSHLLLGQPGRSKGLSPNLLLSEASRYGLQSVDVCQTSISLVVWIGCPVVKNATKTVTRTIPWGIQNRGGNARYIEFSYGQ